MTGRPPRLDWCHALPVDAWPLDRALLRGCPADLGPALLHLGVVREVVAELEPHEQVQLLVVGEQQDVRELPRLLEQLAPGGVLYLVRGRALHPARGLAAARRAVQRAGLHETGQWALLPSASAPRRHLPLHHRGVWSWYTATLLLAGTPTARAQRAVLRLASRWPRLLQALLPGSSLLARRPAPDEPPQDPAGALVVLTSGYDAGSRTILLPFAPAARWPSEALKIATEPLLRDATRLEHARLVRLHGSLPPAVAACLPQPRGIVESPSRTVRHEQAVAGATMLVASAEWSRRPGTASRDLDAVATWLLELGRVTRQPAPGDPGRTWLLEPLERLQGMRAVDPSVVALVRRAASCLAALDTPALCTVEQHHDVAPANIIRTGTGIVVVDWELDPGAGRTGWGPPLVDLLYFACSWYFLSTGRTSREQECEGLRAFFVAGSDDGWQAQLLEQRLEDYRRQSGLPREATWALLTACWLERALTAHLRWVRLGSVGDPDDTGLVYLGLLAASHSRFTDRWRTCSDAGPRAVAPGPSHG